jgi:hypothetical protein
MTCLPLLDNIGKSVVIEYEDGSKQYYTVVDEIPLLKPETPNRALCFQQLQSNRDKRVQYRFCHYFADKSEWVFAQLALYVPDRDFQALIHEASKRGWIDLSASGAA